MAADFYRSSHGNYWIIDRKTLAAARSLDLKYATPQEIAWIGIWSANAIHKLAKRLNLRQQVTATAIVYLRRFYLKNSYCETDVPLVAAACVYVAAKAEETAMHIKVVVTEARATFNEYGITRFPSDSTKLAEMEFYLIEDLEFHLIVYHPYRSLVQMTGRDSGPTVIRESMLDMDDNSLQMAWFVLNDTYRSELCLLYPPHMIAIASIYLAFSLHMPQSVFGNPTVTPSPVSTTSESRSDAGSNTTNAGGQNKGQSPNVPTSSTTPANSNTINPPSANKANASIARGKTDPITFLAALNVQIPIVLEIVQEIISLYTLWKNYEETPATSGSNTTGGNNPTSGATGGGMRSPSAVDILSSNLGGSANASMKRNLTMSSLSGVHVMGNLAASNAPGAGDERVIQILNRMRANREMDLAHPPNAGQDRSK